MNRDDIIRMAKEADAEITNYINYVFDENVILFGVDQLERFAALVAAAERNKLAQWMVSLGYATGHGDTMEDLLEELEWQVTESWSKVVVASVEAEREACAKMCDDWPNGRDDVYSIGEAIRSRGER